MSDKVKLEGILEKGYGISPKLVMRDKDLSIEAKAIYAYMSSFAGNGESAFPSIKLACIDLNVSENRFRKHRDQLVNKGYITIEHNKKKGKFHNNVYIINQIIESPYLQNTMTVKHHDGKTPARQNEGTNNNSSLNNNSSSNNNSKDIVEIINYLNDATGKKYRHSTQKTQSLIKARLNEKFTIDDFKKVIDIKVAEWKHNEKMQKFLRPETLFGTKFEGYLNQETTIWKHDQFDELF